MRGCALLLAGALVPGSGHALLQQHTVRGTAASRSRASLTMASSYSLPDSFDDAVVDCAAAVQKTISGGLAKVRVEFDTSAGDETYTSLRNTLPVAKALTERLAQELCANAPGDGESPKVLFLLFPDEGPAVAGARCSGAGRALSPSPAPPQAPQRS